MKTDTSSPAVMTVGHSNWNLSPFLELLSEFDIDRIIDVRTYPHSRRFPHFSKDNLKESLEEVEVRYEHWPELGGYRSSTEDRDNAALSDGFKAVADHLNSPEGQSTLSELENTLRETYSDEAISLMCAEKNPQQCHRKLISDHLLVREISVRHVIDKQTARKHQLHPYARQVKGTVRYPGLV